MTTDELLACYRRIMNCIHEGGNIFYDAALLPAVKQQREDGVKEGESVIICGRYEAYKMIAVMASELRQSKV
jgi:hypothetical protein